MMCFGQYAVFTTPLATCKEVEDKWARRGSLESTLFPKQWRNSLRDEKTTCVTSYLRRFVNCESSEPPPERTLVTGGCFEVRQCLLDKVILKMFAGLASNQDEAETR